MNKTVKIGLASFASGVVLNILVRIVGPPILQRPFDSLKLPLLAALGTGLVLSILLILVGVIICLIGAVKQH
jgi:hypothetical protein